MKYYLVTTFSKAGYEEYGKTFIDCFNKFWPEEVELLIYTDEPVDVGRGKCLIIKDECPELISFKERHKHDLEKCGKKPNELWKEKNHERGYFYRLDSMKFCHQAMVPYYSLQEVKEDKSVLIWMDADTTTDHKIDISVVKSLLPKNKDVAYLKRIRLHTECGIILFRMNDVTRSIIKEWFDLFNTDRIFKEEFWNSADAFDYAIRNISEKTNIQEHNLSGFPKGHVWHTNDILNAHFDHLKGSRKERGESKEKNPKYKQKLAKTYAKKARRARKLKNQKRS